MTDIFVRGGIPEMHTQRQGHVETARRQLSVSPESELSSYQPCWMPNYRFAVSKTIKKTPLYCLDDPACGILLWQPSQAEANTENKYFYFWRSAIYQHTSFMGYAFVSLCPRPFCLNAGHKIFFWKLNSFSWFPASD